MRGIPMPPGLNLGARHLGEVIDERRALTLSPKLR